MEYEDYCEVWPENPKILEDESRELSLDSPMFSLVFHVSFVHLPQDFMDEDEDELSEINELTETAIDDQTFDVERDRLVDDDRSREILEGILFLVHVPSKPFFLDKILNCARDMANDKAYENCKVLRMHVRMSVFEERREEDESRMVGASKAAMEKLHKFEIEDDQTRKEACAICLEEFWLGLQVIRMPCSHVFHSNCIVNWLNKSKFCPLCRFEMN